MGRYAHSRRATCESCLFIDMREMQRQRSLWHAGQRFTCFWTRYGKPLGSLDVRTEADAVVLIMFTARSERQSVEQRVPLVWTRCHLGGRRPWFLCACGRRVAKLYGAPVFACRQCCGLAYRSQQEIPRHRAILRAQRLKMRLGGSANLSEPLPGRPRGMHRWTYRRLLARAMAAQERSVALELEYMRQHYPGL
jgi:hypothetical protein